MNVTHIIRRLQQIATAAHQARSKAAGLDLTAVQLAALEALAARPGIDQAGLAAAIGSDRATVGGVVDRLEAKGLVRRTVRADDRRARVLRLAAEGERLVVRLGAIMRGIEDEILAGLAPDDRATFLALAAQAVAAAEDQTAPNIFLNGAK